MLSSRQQIVRRVLVYVVTTNLLLATLLSIAGVVLAANTTVYAGFDKGDRKSTRLNSSH